MEQHNRQPQFCTPPAAIFQWQWEEAVNALRRRACEEEIQRHWATTGMTAVDATARAHIADWLVIDGAIPGKYQPESIVDALVHRALMAEPWDLYVVEGEDSSVVSVRGLRDNRGHHVRWLEGRICPPVGSTVALRLIHLDPPGLCASTLPVVFGDEIGAKRLILALLRSFGAHEIGTWREFMGGPGARIILEYGLSCLQGLAAEKPDTGLDAFPSIVEEAFRRLESALIVRPDSVPRRCELHDGKIAWIEDITEGPHLMIFDRIEDCRRYRRAMTSNLPSRGSGGGVAWCRIYRDGLIQIQRRDRQGQLIDPCRADFHAIESACRRMVNLRRHCAA